MHLHLYIIKYGNEFDEYHGKNIFCLLILLKKRTLKEYIIVGRIFYDIMNGWYRILCCTFSAIVDSVANICLLLFDLSHTICIHFLLYIETHPMNIWKKCYSVRFPLMGYIERKYLFRSSNNVRRYAMKNYTRRYVFSCKFTNSLVARITPDEHFEHR